MGVELEFFKLLDRPRFESLLPPLMERCLGGRRLPTFEDPGAGGEEAARMEDEEEAE